MKKITNHSRAIFAIAMMLCIALPAFAHDFEVDGIYYNITSSTDKTVSVTYKGNYSNSYSNEYTGTITIPSSVTYSGSTYSVTSIGEDAFYNCTGLTSVTIPNSVTSIGSSAFGDCRGLTSVTIPNPVTSIGNEAFYYCTGLTSVTIPNSVTSIGDYAFAGCHGLTSVTIPNSVTSIGDHMFYFCDGLTSITIPNSVTSIGERAFSYCSKLTEVTISDLSAWCKIDFANYEANPLYYAEKLKLNGSEIKDLVIPNDITKIKNYTFYNCSGLTSVTIPNSVTSIGERAFYSCSGLTSVTIPNSVTSIGDSAFRGCSGLTEVYYNAENCSSMGSSGYPVFSGCTNLKMINIGDCVKTIPSYAFCDCSGLSSVTIGNSVTSIGNYAFNECTSLAELIFVDGKEILSLGYNYYSNYTGKGLFYDCPLEKLYLGRNLSYNSSNYCGYSPFYNKNIKSITFGSAILSIDEKLMSTPIKTIWLTNTPPTGYKYAEGIVNYVSNDLYTELADKTVYPYLSSIFDVDGVNYVPVSPSERTCDALDCTYESAIDSVYIGKTVSYKGIAMNIKNVNHYTFYKNSYLNKVTIDDEFSGSLGDFAFAECCNVDGIELPNKVQAVGSNCFEGCGKLEYAIIGTSIPAINNYTFNRCSSLAEIKIPKNVESVGNFAFGGCKALEQVSIANRETIIELGANGSSPLFVDCPLDSVYIGGNISYNITEKFGYSPFYRNTSLRAVTITDKETEISDNEFYGCTNLKYVSIGDGVESIGNWAFSGCSSLDYFAFGSSMKTIGEEAFSDCTAVTKIYSRATTPPVCGKQALDDINKWTCELYVPGENISDYQATDQWKEFFFMYDGVEGVESDNNAIEIVRYDIHGRLLTEPTKGINIIKMSNGTTRKEFVK